MKTADTLLHCIQNETDAMASLVDVLAQEQVALTQAPTLELMEEIRIITQKKTQIINTISQIGHSRQTELVRRGFNATETTLPEWLENKEQSDAWAKLIQQTEKAKELNRVNGLLITRHINRNQSTLQVLYANQHTNSPALYGADGQSNAPRAKARGVTA